MPGWHRVTDSFQKAGKLKIVGIVEEQHPDRARLFMQWKQMTWPIMIDPLNLLDVAAVPITLLIDENGIIRYVNPPISQAVTIVQEFIKSSPQRDDIVAISGDSPGSLPRPFH